MDLFFQKKYIPLYMSSCYFYLIIILKVIKKLHKVTKLYKVVTRTKHSKPPFNFWK